MTTDNNILIRTIRLIHYYPRSIYWLTSRLLLLTLAITALLLVVSPSYDSVCRVTTLPSSFELSYTRGRSDSGSPLGPAMVLSQTHTEYLLSRPIAEEVVNRLTLEGVDPIGRDNMRQRAFSAASGLLRNLYNVVNYGGWRPASPYDSFVHRVQKSLTVDNIPGSFILEVRSTWSDPEMAARIANLATERYVEKTRADNQEEMRVTREFIGEDVAKTVSDLDAVERDIEAFKESRRFYIGEQDVSLKLDRVAALSSQFDALRAEIAQLDRKYDVLDEYSPPSALAALASDIAGLNAKKEMVETSLAMERDRLSSYPDSERRLLAMVRTKLQLEHRLATLQGSLLETRISEASQISSVKIIDPAQPAESPTRPRIVKNGLLAILVGIVLSALHITASEHFGRSVRTEDDFGEEQKRVLGVIPYNPPWLRAADDDSAEHDSLLGRLLGREAPVLERFIWDLNEYASHLGTWDSPTDRARTRAQKQQSIFDRHVDHLLESLCTGAGGGMLVIFTSIHEARGKSHIVEHLARRGAYAGRKILVIDGNTVRPHLHEAFGKTLDRGLTNLIAGEPNLRLNDVITHVDDHVDLVSAGTRALDNREKWLIEDLGRQLREIAGNYDLILMDTVSLKMDPLVRRFWGLSDELVCVVDACTCTRADLDGLRERTLGYGNRISFVLNNVKYRRDYLYDS